MPSDSANILLAAAAGAAAATVVLGMRHRRGLALAAEGGQGKTEASSTILARLFGPSHFSIVVFLDDGGDAASPPKKPSTGKNIRFPRQGGYDALVGAVISAFAADAPAGKSAGDDGDAEQEAAAPAQLAPAVSGDLRLFLGCAKTELRPENVAEALAAAAGADDSVVVLLATVGGKDLSASAAALPPLGPVPMGPKPWPIVGNGYLFAPTYLKPEDGGVTGMYAAWKRAFVGPDGGLPAWGPTISARLPSTARAGLAKLAAEGVLDEVAAGDHMILTVDPAIVEELATHEDLWPKMWNRANQTALSDFTKDGLFTSSTTSEDWVTGHGLLPRFFSALRMPALFPPVLDKSRTLVHALRTKFPSGTPITNFNAYLTAMTSDAVLLAALGLDAHSIDRLAADEPMHPLLPAFLVGLTITSRGYGPAASVLLPASVRYNPLVSKDALMKAMYADAKKTCETVINGLIDEARASGGPDSLLKVLLTQASPTNGKMASLEAIHGHMLNLMIAGHETTAATLGFALYYLATHPEWDARAMAEIEEVLGERGEPTVGDLSKLVVLEAIFRECLRLHPPVGGVSRDASADTTLGGGRWVVRRGQRVLVNVVGLHRRQDIWGGPEFGDATAFNPARFLPGAGAGRHRYAYLPFGFGVRACAGTQFALLEAKTLLAIFLRNFIVRTPPGYRAFSSFRDGGAAPTPDGLTLMLLPRPGAPPPAKVPPPTANGNGVHAPGPPPASAEAARAATAAGLSPAVSAAKSVASHGTPLRVLYGSNGGTCEALAGQLVQRAIAAGWDAAQAPLDSAVGKLAGPPGPVVVITSTYNGSPPDNAAKFVAWIEDASTAAAAAADGVKYAVFGVGNSQWGATFLLIGKKIDAALEAAGGTRIRPLASADADDLGSFSDNFDDWAAALLPELAANFGVVAAAGEGAAAAAAAAAAELAPRALLEPAAPGATVLGPKEVVDLWRAGEPDPTQGYHALPVVALTQLQAPGSDRKTAALEVRLPPGLAYSAGDHFELLPANAPHLVSAALGVLGMTGDEAYKWTPVGDAATHGPARGLAATGRTVHAPLVIRARAALEWLVDLSATPSRKAVARLAEACPCPPEAAALKALATEEGYKAGVAGPRMALVDLLTRFKSAAAAFDLASFINAQPRLTPRYYSISSSPKFGGEAGATRATITVGLVSTTTAAGRPHLGPASSTVHAAVPGGVVLGTVRALQSRFRLPADPKTPCIMVGPGTGVAPMIGFLEEREALQKAGATLGPAILFFGCRNEDDFIYRSRLEGWLKAGVLMGLHVAFSRPKGGSASSGGQQKVYVQDLLAREAGALWPLLAGGGHVYVCGDARKMAPDVRRAFEEAVVQGAGARGAGAGAAFVGAMREDGRYLEDVWAG